MSIKFALTYLEKDKYFNKFFILYPLFCFAQNLIILNDNLNAIYAGLEILGITSIFLISYFHERKQALENALKTLVIYKIGDMFFLVALSYLYSLNVEVFTLQSLSHLPSWGAFLFVLSCFVKSAIYPFTYWLPKSVEGPTPTSAVYYGALSVNIGPILFLLAYPHLKLSGIYLIITILLLIISALIGFVHSRINSDAKVTIVYSGMTHISLVYLEIMMGFEILAMIHLVCNLIVRSYQMLFAPSLFQNILFMEKYYNYQGQNNVKHLEHYLSPKIRRYFYRMGLDEWGLENLWNIFIFQPGRSLAFLFNHKTFFSKIQQFGNYHFLIILSVLIAFGIYLNTITQLNIPWPYLLIPLIFVYFLLFESINDNKLLFVGLNLLIINLVKDAIILKTNGNDDHAHLFTILSFSMTILLNFFIFFLWKKYHISQINQYQGFLENHKILGGLFLAVILSLGHTPFLLLSDLNEHNLHAIALQGNLAISFGLILLDNLYAFLLIKLAFRILFGSDAKIHRGLVYEQI